jgi:hypothetical protein
VFALQDGDYEYEVTGGKVTITKYTGEATTVSIPATIKGLPVTGIGDRAFYMKRLTSVTIPDSVTTIGPGAFGKNPYEGTPDDNHLTSVTIGSSVTTIGAGAFSGNSLTRVTIPNSVTTIGYMAFSRNMLTSVTIPYSVTSIEAAAFESNSYLVGINVDTNNKYYTSIDGVLFNKDMTILHTVPMGKKITTYTIPNSVTTIGEFAFTENQLTSVTIPGSVTIIGERAFSSCDKLTSVNIPNSVTSIGFAAFSGCRSLPAATRAEIERRFGDDVV